MSECRKYPFSLFFPPFSFYIGSRQLLVAWGTGLHVRGGKLTRSKRVCVCVSIHISHLGTLQSCFFCQKRHIRAWRHRIKTDILSQSLKSTWLVPFACATLCAEFTFFGGTSVAACASRIFVVIRETLCCALSFKKKRREVYALAKGNVMLRHKTIHLCL